MDELVTTVKIEVGKEYPFYCEVAEENKPASKRMSRFTGQIVLVLGLVTDNDPDNSPLYQVRFPDGSEGQAWEEEINGWDKALGQYERSEAPRANVAHALHQHA